MNIAFGYWQLFVCGFAFLALMAIWWHLGKRKGDHGQVWLALSVLAWSFAGALQVFWGHNSNESYLAQGWQSIISIFNSFFILLALPYFQFIPSQLKHLIKSSYWKYIIGLPFLFSLLPTLSKMMGLGEGPIRELDVYFSLLTLLFLAAVLWESFEKRKLRMLAYLSILAIFVTLLAQFSKLDFLLPLSLEGNLTLLSAIFKTLLIMIFFALALSWVKDENKEQFILPEGIKWQLVPRQKVLVIKQGEKERKLSLNQTRFDLLLAFANAKLEDNRWLRIKPKELKSRQEFDISDHNQVRRLAESLLDGMYGSHQWKLSEEGEHFKQHFFEKATGKIRLTLKAEQLEIHS